MAQLQAQKEKENAMYKYDHMFKGIILPSLGPGVGSGFGSTADEIYDALVRVLADTDISELGGKVRLSLPLPPPPLSFSSMKKEA